MEVKKKPVKLTTVFIRYLAVFCVGTILLLGGMAGLFFTMSATGGVYPANYAETQLENKREIIETENEVTPDMITDLCRYAVYTTDGNYIDGTVEPKDRNMLWNAYREGATQIGAVTYAKYFVRDGEVCIAVYSIKMQFVNRKLRNLISNVDLLFLGLFIVLFVCFAVLIARHFGRYMKKQLEVLEQTTKHIQGQDLTYTEEHSEILEVDQLLNLLFRLKEALRLSLEEQWHMEEQKKYQIAALAHDIKTPLTIIRGNSELMAEAESVREAGEYSTYVLEGVSDIEHYLQCLQEMLNMDLDRAMQKAEMKPMDVSPFIDKIVGKAHALSGEKRIHMEQEIKGLPVKIEADEAKLERVLLNVVANAVEYTPVDGYVKFSVKQVGNRICFTVVDDGPGFTKEGLESAAEQFFRQDKSRNARGHYGMGLYIVKTFVEQMGGELWISNSRETGGAHVEIRI